MSCINHRTFIRSITILKSQKLLKKKQNDCNCINTTRSLTVLQTQNQRNISYFSKEVKCEKKKHTRNCIETRISDNIIINKYFTLMNPISLALLRKHCLQQLRPYFLISPCEFPHTRLHKSNSFQKLDPSISSTKT